MSQAISWFLNFAIVLLKAFFSLWNIFALTTSFYIHVLFKSEHLSCAFGANEPENLKILAFSLNWVYKELTVTSRCTLTWQWAWMTGSQALISSASSWISCRQNKQKHLELAGESCFSHKVTVFFSHWILQIRLTTHFQFQTHNNRNNLFWLTGRQTLS